MFTVFSMHNNWCSKELLQEDQGWKILKISTRPTSPYVLVNSIIYTGNSLNFYSSCRLRQSPWPADEWIFSALKIFSSTHNTIYFGKYFLLLIPHFSWPSVYTCKL